MIATSSLLISRGNKPRTGQAAICGCGTEFYRGPNATTKYCSRVCYWKEMKGKPAKNKGVKYPQLTGANNPAWKDDVSYSGVHRWLYRNFGKANTCEFCSNTSGSKRCEWALKAGLQYEKKRENFIQLCKVCHNSYDEIAKKLWQKRRLDNDEKIKTIRRLYQQGVSQKDIAARFDYCQSNICRIVSGETWI